MKTPRQQPVSTPTDLAQRHGRSGPGIQDVAHVAGVSVGTVSHVLNHPELVREDLRQHVQRVIAELGYRPNALARGLRQHRTMTIGLVLSDITTPYAATVARTLEREASRAGMSLVLADTDEEPALERRTLETFCDKGIDGVILAPTSGDLAYLESYRQRGWPMVAVNRRPVGIELPTVISDNTGGARAATRHLIEHGHRRIAVITRKGEVSSSRDRLEGYSQALASAGLSQDPLLIAQQDASVQGGIRAARWLIDRAERPTALLSLSSAMSLGTVVGLRDCGVRVPDDVALIGFDDADWSEAVSPPMTNLSLSARDVAARAASMLLDWIVHEQAPSVLESLVPTELVIRDSCGCHVLPPDPSANSDDKQEYALEA